MVAIAPNSHWAVTLWLLRAALSHMDIPARDALTMSVVPPEERVTMASLHLVGRNSAGAVGPTISTALWQHFGAAVPVMIGGSLKVLYDLSLFAMFRNIERTPVEGRDE